MIRNNYMVPDESDATFDAAAAQVLRSYLRNYTKAPNDIRSVLEDVAIVQESAKMRVHPEYEIAAAIDCTKENK